MKEHPTELDEVLGIEPTFPEESPYKNTAALVFPVEFDGYVSTVKDPHITVSFLPNLYLDSTVAYTKEHVLAAMVSYRVLHGANAYHVAKVTGADAFGPDKNVPVLLLEELYWLKSVHESVTTGFTRKGVEYSKLYDFTPHVAVDLATALNRPKQIIIRPLELWWNGTEKLEVY